MSVNGFGFAGAMVQVPYRVRVGSAFIHPVGAATNVAMVLPDLVSYPGGSGRGGRRLNE